MLFASAKLQAEPIECLEQKEKVTENYPTHAVVLLLRSHCLTLLRFTVSRLIQTDFGNCNCRWTFAVLCLPGPGPLSIACLSLKKKTPLQEVGFCNSRRR